MLYHIPRVGSLDSYKAYIKQLPSSDDPEVFGMHDNANIAYQEFETDKMLRIIGNI